MASVPRDAVPGGRSRFASFLRSESWGAKVVVVVLVVAAAIAFSWLLIRLLPVLFVIVGALFLVGTLGPIVRFIAARGVKRNVAVGLVFGALVLGTLGLLAVAAAPLIAQIGALVAQAPQIRDDLANLLGRSRFTASFGEHLKQFSGIPKEQVLAAFTFSTHAAMLVGYAVSSLFIALYVMLDRERARGALFALIPRRHHMKLTRVLMRLEHIVGSYIRGQFITSALMAVFTFLLLTIAGVGAALPLALFAGIADVLPYIGVFLSIGPAVLATIPNGAAWTFGVLGAMLAYEELESRFIVPRVYGDALRLPAWVVLVALLGGGELGGILGALVALPVAAAILMLVEELVPRMPGEVVTAERESRRARLQRAQSEYDVRTEALDTRESSAIAFEIHARAFS